MCSILHNVTRCCLLYVASPKERLALRCSFFNDTAPTEIYTLSLHDALPIYQLALRRQAALQQQPGRFLERAFAGRSEEHTSELQSRVDLVCRLLLEKKKGMILTSEAVVQGVCSCLDQIYPEPQHRNYHGHHP